MGDRGEDMQQRTTGRNRTRVAAIKTEPLMVRALPGEAPGRPTHAHFCGRALRRMELEEMLKLY